MTKYFVTAAVDIPDDRSPFFEVADALRNDGVVTQIEIDGDFYKEEK